MKRMFNKIIFSLIFIFSCFFCISKVDAADEYIIHLYFNVNENTLYFDKKQNPVDINKNNSIGLKEFFDKQDAIKDADYILKIQPSNAAEVDIMKFNKQAGQFDLKIPFFVSGEKINIYDFHSGKKIDSADITAFQTCNNNNICEYEKGETTTNCIADCGKAENKYSDQTKELLEKNKGVIRDSETGQFLLVEPRIIKSYEQKESQTKTRLYIIISLSIISLSAAGFFAYKKFFKKV